MSYDHDPLANDDGASSGNPIRTDRSKAGTSRFGLLIEDIGDIMTGDYGDYRLITGELLYQVDALGGTADEPEAAPEVGDTVSYLVGNWVEPEDGKPRHIQEEIQKSVRKVTKRPGFVRQGDTLHVKLVELVMTKANGTKYPKNKEFGRHVVLVERPTPDSDPLADTIQSDDAPF